MSTGPAQRVEVFAWATDGNPDLAVEKAAVDALVAVFEERCPGQEFVNPVAGGGFADPAEALRCRLRDNPPDGFQVHPGGEVVDHVAAGELADLDEQFARWGLFDLLPPGLLDGITLDGRIYCVPAGLHRLLLWSNREALAKAGLDDRPATFDEFVHHLDALRAAGIEHPLALGANWNQLELLEGLLLAELGPERFETLWTAEADWSVGDVTVVLERFELLLSYSNPDRDTLRWPDAAKLLSSGSAGYLFLGDWVVGELERNGLSDYAYQPFPGAEGTFQWLGDGFALPKNAPNVTGANGWLETVASAPGQRAFNLLKGSVPVRGDVDTAGFSAYQREAIADLRRSRLVPSITHGSACAIARTVSAMTAVGRFSAVGGVADLQAAMTAVFSGRE
ncbi:ABC transporter substrate-binding protein [Amycolatopsis samaneae]|uniref:Probable sugar-binding periplasmic protein n=1 Tax=Amycolatopsis samaneae TaxID=664691 RepID=A0ABW5GTJ9_9PSEU